MSFRLLRAPAAALLTVLLAGLVAALPAHAERARTINACLYDYNDTWGDIAIWVDGTAAASDRTVRLTGATAGAELPQWLPDALAYATGNGTHRLKLDAWLALAGEGSVQGTQVLHTTGTGTMTVNGMTISPLAVELQPLPDTTWTALPGGGPLTLRQGGPAALGPVRAAPGNNLMTPAGSVLIRATYQHPLAGLLRFYIDCQPGTTPNGTVSNSTRFTAAASSPLATFSFGPLGGVTPTQPAAGGDPATTGAAGGGAATDRIVGASVASTSLRLGTKAVLVRVACPAGGPPCRGGLRLTSVARLTFGAGGARLRLLGASTYSVKAGATAITKVPLTADGRRARRKPLRVLVTLNPSSGGGAVTKRLRATVR